MGLYNRFDTYKIQRSHLLLKVWKRGSRVWRSDRESDSRLFDGGACGGSSYGRFDSESVSRCRRSRLSMRPIIRSRPTYSAVIMHGTLQQILTLTVEGPEERIGDLEVW